MERNFTCKLPPPLPRAAPHPPPPIILPHIPLQSSGILYTRIIVIAPLLATKTTGSGTYSRVGHRAVQGRQKRGYVEHSHPHHPCVTFPLPWYSGNCFPFSPFLFPTNILFRAVPWLRRLVAGLPLRRPGLDPGSVHVGFVVDKAALGQVFPRVLRFSPVNIIPLVFHY
jgi:hypothetical protein